MECEWDAHLLEHIEQLPFELLSAIQHGSNELYLEVMTRTAIDARYTDTLFAHCEPIFAHVCSTLRSHCSLAATVATLGRTVPFATYLAPYATRYLSSEAYNFLASPDSHEDLLYLLGLFRLLRFNHRTFKNHVQLADMYALLKSSRRPVVYMAIRILQIRLDGADHWFEEMVKQYLGKDTPMGDINGLWDDKVIDYRFLPLWENERYEKLQKMRTEVRAAVPRSVNPGRVIPEDAFHPSTALIGKLLLPCIPTAAALLFTSSQPVVSTPTVARNLHDIVVGLKSDKPLLLTGLTGSGKTLLIRHVAERLGKLDKLVTLHLNEQSDAKMLIGFYTSGNMPGSFVWKPGVLTTAVQEGRWVLIEDIDRAPNEIISTLLPLVERREMQIPSRKQIVHAEQGFRILATVRSNLNHHGEETRPLSQILGVRHWNHIRIAMPGVDELRQIVSGLFPSLSALIPQLMAVFERLKASRQHPVLVGQSKTGVLSTIPSRGLLKWCGRISRLLHKPSSFTSSELDEIFVEAIDCFAGALPEGSARSALVATIAEELRIDPQRREFLTIGREIRYEVDKSCVTIGRYSLIRAPSNNDSLPETFSTNPHTSRMLERVVAAVVNREPLLLVGETGVGKTTAVQNLAERLNKKLQVFNLSQQSEAGDLLGGFKPVAARHLVVRLNDDFDELFRSSFSVSKNQQFLELFGKQMANGNWKAVCKLWHHAVKMVDKQRAAYAARSDEAPNKKRKVEPRAPDFTRWDAFAVKVSDIERRLATGSESFAFTFVEGNIVRAVRDGNWVLLDEINLASMDTLESIVDLLDPNTPSLLLTEAGNIARIDAHPDFRIFAAMNPATDVGKKDLPAGIRSRFTEIYVESPDKDFKSLRAIVTSYLRTHATVDQNVAVDVSTLYQKIIALSDQNKLVDGASQKPHFSLRTLTRTLNYAVYMAPQCSLRRSLYEGFQMSFLTFLDAESARLVLPLLEQHLLGKRTNLRGELQRALRMPDDAHQYVMGWPGSKHWVRRGEAKLEDQPQYILTPFIQGNLENLVRAASTRQFPVLIQGPTSSGKTSMIEYLAKRTGHHFVRINNHEHTDIQEYFGTYVSSTDGRLQFQEGILVRALRQGHWLVLDELNLAPTDVLEALNRLLDDNRELLVPETQVLVRPHEGFMLFATQNPAGLYGGRKMLSRAFRNRFLELHFDDIPINELQEILHRRTQLPESRCKRIVTVYRELSVLRQENRLFEQKSFATLRDLFRWATRPNYTVEQLAANGFLLLAERVRKPEERRAVKQIIEQVMSAKGPRVVVDEQALYAETNVEIQLYQRSAKSHDIALTKAMRRLYLLVSHAIQNNEPVLLIGETGCGKTTVCQMLADACDIPLHMVNAHQNMETGDLVGSQRPVRNRAGIEADLRRQLLSSALLQDLDTAATHSTDALLFAYDNAVDSLGKYDKQAHVASSVHRAIHVTRTRYKALFEWVDGSLVQAMKEGSFFLLDEISLADDSVLERINSVLESQRSIMLAEKGSLDSYVTAAPGFQFFATMNPGGDYGKRELSPALRNRFTEIWVPPFTDSEDVSLVVRSKLADVSKRYADAIVAFARWFRDRYNTSVTSSISMRDVLAWVDFINTFSHEDVLAAVVHGAAMVYIDTLGANPAGLITLSRSDIREERMACLAELGSQIGANAAEIYFAHLEVHHQGHTFGIGPFNLACGVNPNASRNNFTFDASTTRQNAMRVIRALQLRKPVMLEGSPGVGKTALISAIASAVDIPLTRINLSEQTDILDLFGADAPVEGQATCTFAWRDAPFLRGMKNGEWVLLDEMNLASQSVLEGLNACLDHRGQIFVPELGQTFNKHPHFRLFAAQNPHHQGGGRKGLPASFVNRFTVVYADALSAEDLRLICHQLFPELDSQIIQQAVGFVEQLACKVGQRHRFGSAGAPWEFNLRDISRWLTLVSDHRCFLRAGTHQDFVHMLFSQRLRSTSDKCSVHELFVSSIHDNPHPHDLFCNLSPRSIQVGFTMLPRDPLAGVVSNFENPPRWTKTHLQVLHSVMLSVQQGWPVILTGTSGTGKTWLLHTLANLIGTPVVTISINAETDAMDLIGGYEQADPWRHAQDTLAELRKLLTKMVKSGLVHESSLPLAKLFTLLDTRLMAIGEISRLSIQLRADIPACELSKIDDLLRVLERSSEAVDMARFEWVDGLLVEAIRQGQWLILDNANLCSASVLDRLNSLLEPNGSLVINEHTEENGAPRVIHPHPRFRIFLTVDPQHGELSRAMRNRAVELYLPPEHVAVQLANPVFPESALARFAQMKAITMISDNLSSRENLGAVIVDHLAMRDIVLQPRFAVQLQNGLYDANKLARHDFVTQTNMTSETQMQYLLREFYASALGDSLASADLVDIQTLHPLNNQALVCSEEEHLRRASTLAFVSDASKLTTSLLKILDQVTSSPSATQSLSKIERSLLARRELICNFPGLLNSVADFVRMATRWLQKASPLESIDIQELQNIFFHVCAMWSCLLRKVQQPSFDEAYLNTWLCTAESVTALAPQDHASFHGRVLSPFAQGLAIFRRSKPSLSGIGCLNLWHTFRPPVPSSLARLSSLLEFEKVVDRYDDLCNAAQSSMEDVVGLRMTLKRALCMGADSSVDLQPVAQKLEELKSATKRSISEMPTPSSGPFRSAFDIMRRHFAVLTLERECILPTEHAALDVLAQCRIRDSFSPRASQPNDWAPHETLRLLGYALQIPSIGGNISNDWFQELQAGMGNVSNISVSRLDLLDIETKLLAQTIATKAHLLGKSELPALNTCLARLFSNVLDSLNSGAADPMLSSLVISARSVVNAEGVLDLLDSNPSSIIAGSNLIDSHCNWIKEQLTRVARYLRSSTLGEASQAAEAWWSYGLACLMLYVPAEPFDPALKVILELELYQDRKDRLLGQLQALHAFRSKVTGIEDCFRSRSIEQDLQSLGPEPPASNVCRPEAPELDALQGAFSSLLRIIEPLVLQCSVWPPAKANELVWTNLQHIRERLISQYHAYADLSTPVVGFIDCLRIGRYLSLQVEPTSQQPHAAVTLFTLTPFLSGSLQVWISDEAFCRALASDLTFPQRLFCLSVFRVRCSIWPLKHCSVELQHLVEAQFSRFHDRWKSKLNSEQRHAAAKSSLFHYRVDEDLDDTRDDGELESLFPNGDMKELEHEVSVRLPLDLEDYTTQIVSLYRTIYWPTSSIEPQSLHELLRQFVKLAKIPERGFGAGDKTVLAIVSLQDLTCGLLQDERTENKYNIYTDKNVPQIRKMCSLLGKLDLRFKSIHEAWPEHATPVDAIRLCQQLCEVRHDEPLTKVLPKAEQLHAIVTEWQKIASAKFNVAESLDSLTKLIFSWRQLELLSWKGLLDRETAACARKTASWWYVTYEAIVLASTGEQTSKEGTQRHVEELLATLNGFLNNCSLGEFDNRVALIGDLAAHLDIIANTIPHVRFVQRALSNFTAYFHRFKPAVVEALAKGQRELETEIKNIIQVASWKDRNVAVLKQSAKSSHKRLLRVVRKFRALLAQPAAVILQAGMPDQIPRDISSLDVASPQPPASSKDPPVDEPSLRSWHERPNRFRNIAPTVGLINALGKRQRDEVNAPQRVNSYLEDLGVTIKELQTATPVQLTEKNRTVVQHLKTRKRRLLADTLKDVRLMGFKIGLSEDVRSQQTSMNVIMGRNPALQGDSHRDRAIMEAAEYQFHCLLNIMPTVRESAQKHSDDMTPAEAARCLGLLESVLQFTLDQRAKLMRHLQRIDDLRHTLKTFQRFANSTEPTAAEGGSPLGPSTDKGLSCVIAVVEESIRLVNAQAQLAKKDYGDAIRMLRDFEIRLSQLRHEFDEGTELPEGITDRVVKSRKLRLEQDIQHFRSATATTVQMQPELGFVISHLCRWTELGPGAEEQRSKGMNAIDGEVWIHSLLHTLDQILCAVQELEPGGVSGMKDPSTKAWLFKQHEYLHRQTRALRLAEISKDINGLLQQLQRLDPTGRVTLSDIAGVCRNVCPLLEAFERTAQATSSVSCSLYFETAKMAYRLSTSFVQLAQRGYCTPLGKAESTDQKLDEVEGGTGLGEGDGEEDISRGLGDDEDLSELNDIEQTGGRDTEMADEKDAVEMADEELVGDLDDATDMMEQADMGSEQDVESGIEEEPDGVDSLGPSAIDEKLWDEGQHMESADKNGHDAKGSHLDEKIAHTSSNRKDEENEEEDTEEAPVSAEETPDGQTSQTEHIDPHAQIEEHLTLPEDIMVIDAKKEAEEDDTDLDSLTDCSMENSVRAEGSEVNNDVEDIEQSYGTEDHSNIIDETQEEPADEDKRRQGAEEAGTGEGEHDTEDLMMANPGTDAGARPDGAVFGEDGIGSDENEAKSANPIPVSHAFDQEKDDAAGTPQVEAGATGGSRESEAENAGAHSEGSGERTRLASKQIGDILDQWHRQNRPIKDAEHGDEDVKRQDWDVDMADAQFQHLLETNTDANTQALGSASVEQSKALDEEQGLSVNDTTMTPEHLFKDVEEEQMVDRSQSQQKKPADILHPDSNPAAFVREPSASIKDTDMQDDLLSLNGNNIDDVDEQMLQTHISQDDLNETSSEMSNEEARALWTKHEASTRNLALVLTEHLRLILHPTQATKMRGDFRTGKRLNMKKIIPYIASEYKRDKIWMRRSVPSRRSYQVMLAVDDSKSMEESNSRGLAFDTLALVARAMSMLEVGELGVTAFGEYVTVAHKLSMPFTPEGGAQIYKRFSFAQSKTNIRKLLAETIEMFRSARLKAAGSARNLWQLQIIVSDGVCEDHPTIRQLVRQAHEERIMIVFIVVDAFVPNENTADGSKQSILDLQAAEFVPGVEGEMQLNMVKYLDTFPFKYYLIVRDVQELPAVLAGALRQWFTEVVETGG